MKSKMKLDKIILSGLFIFSNNISFAMNQPNLVEIVCGYIYGHNKYIESQVPSSIVDGMMHENNYSAPCNTPDVFQENSEKLVVEPSLSEISWYLQEPARVAEQMRLSENTSFNRGIFFVDTDSSHNASQAAAPDSPQSTAVDLSPAIKLKKEFLNRNVIFYPGCIVQEKQFGNGFFKKSILKKKVN